MKKAFMIAGSFFLLTACNQSGQQSAGNTVSDTASHSAHNGNTPAAGTERGKDSGDMREQTMMALMERNMDQMEDIKSLGSSDKDFASMMKIHHMGATDMAKLLLAQGTDPQLKDMAQQMIAKQEREIRAFDAFLADSKQNSAATEKNSPFYEQVMKEMDKQKMDKGNHSGSVDQQFIHMMIPHHQGAVAMADLYLKTGAQDQKLKSMANRIKTDQQMEIKQMQAWQARHR